MTLENKLSKEELDDLISAGFECSNNNHIAEYFQEKHPECKCVVKDNHIIITFSDVRTVKVNVRELQTLASRHPYNTDYIRKTNPHIFDKNRK